MADKYARLLRDRRWQRKKAIICERDKWCCVKCGCDRPDVLLHVHHIRYRWKDFYKRVPCDPWDVPDSDLQSLCEVCHAQTHGKKSKVKPKKTPEQEKATEKAWTDTIRKHQSPEMREKVRKAIESMGGLDG